MHEPAPYPGYLSKLVVAEPRHLSNGTWPLRPVRSARVELPDGLHAARAAREAVDALLGRLLNERDTSDVRLVVTELVANGVRHGAAPIVMHVALSDRRLRVEVCDDGPWPTPPENLDPAPGYGLTIIDRMTSRWGIATDGSTCVWVEFDRPTFGVTP